VPELRPLDQRTLEAMEFIFSEDLRRMREDWFTMPEEVTHDNP
jgi:hypothetical protein